ncbi:uncharacterized protein LDX57_004869 [Aspergillus melleus]|uniref:uncharacterized protein n=1 Tax=Aspergillus melleus TaxID=138277 RepID=UPI001E8E810A|nr:uncharacterized protein LDX57_004869 [Aspergillus melleus]KAH8427154.1 hypothetical protein LDX57_004869 [Aspergillus melleus]
MSNAAPPTAWSLSAVLVTSAVVLALLAVLPSWYEAYYDLISKGHGGQFVFQIKRLHKRYGAIVRVGPNEVHIDDPDYYTEVYGTASPSRPIDKLVQYNHRFGMTESIISMVEFEHHRIRRAAIAPLFSQTGISFLDCTRLSSP